jgi:small subunit ribosomal protein S1
MIVFDTDTDVSPVAAAQDAPAPVEENTQQPSEAASDAGSSLSKYEQLRRSKTTLDAKVKGWAHNGLEVVLEDGTVAAMPNNHIDLDPDRNIANYFGKTIPVRVLDVRTENGTEHVRVSHRMILDEDLRKNAKDALEHLNIGDVTEVKVKSFNIKDVVVDLGPGIEAIIFGRDLSWQRFDHPYEITKRGDTLQAKVLELDKRKRYVRFGVKQLTADPLVEKFTSISEGDVVTAKVSSIVDQGAEVELPNGLTAFLPISEIAWERIPTVGDAISVGEEFEVKLLTIEAKRHRITCSKKRLIENPARQREENYKVGTDHNATIKEVTKGGLVVGFEDGNEGFVPRRELSHDRIERLEDVFKKDKPIEGLRVIEYDRRNGKISLSLIAAEKEAQRTTLRQYRATAKGSSFSLGELASLKEKLEQAERGG